MSLRRIAALLLAISLGTPAAAAAPEETGPPPRPRWSAQTGEPGAQTDFTAYTLEFGEVRIGPRMVGVGVLPGVQLSTQPLLDAGGLTNAAAKIDLLTVGPLDVAANGSFGHRHEDPYNAVLANAGGTASVRIANAAIHGGAQWLYFAAIGEPDLVELSQVSPSLARVPTPAIRLLQERYQYEVRVEMVVVNAAADIRLNRRDSLLLLGTTPVWTVSQLPDWAARYGGEYDGPVGAFESWSLAFAWQMHFRNIDLRVGIGTSPVPGAWVAQAFDLSWRFGGPTRAAWRKDLRAWRAER